MIYHVNRASFKAGVSAEDKAASYELLRQAGADNPAVRAFALDQHTGGEFEYDAVFVLETLDDYWAYLSFPAHIQAEMQAIALLDRFEAFDISDSGDPDTAAEIQRIQARHFAETPQLAALVAQAGSFSTPLASGPEHA